MTKVNVLLNLIQNVKSEVKKVERDLDSLDKKQMKANLDIDDNGSIQKTRAELDALARERKADIQPDIDELRYGTAEAKIESLTKDRVVNIRGEFNWNDAAGQWTKNGDFVSRDEVPEDVKERLSKIKSLSNRGEDVEDGKNSLRGSNLINPALNKHKDEKREARNKATRAPIPNRVSEAKEAAKEQAKEFRKNIVHGTEGLTIQPDKSDREYDERQSKSGFSATDRDGPDVGSFKRRTGESIRRKARQGQLDTDFLDPIRNLGDRLNYITNRYRNDREKSINAKDGINNQESVTEGFQAADRDARQVGSLQERTQSIRRKARQGRLDPEAYGSVEQISKQITKEEEKQAKETKKKSKNIKKAKRHSSGLLSGIRGHLPTLSTWYRLIGGILPMVIALSSAVVGLGAAFGTAAAAGGAFVGLGLLGHGEGIADSMSLAKRRVNELKRELFRMFRPIFQSFAPISERFFSSLTTKLQPLRDALQDIVVFEDMSFALFDDAVGFVTGLIEKLTGMKSELNNIMGMADGGGQFILDLLGNAIQEASENQNFFSNLATMLWELLGVVYNLSMAFARMAIVFKPVIALVKTLTSYLDNTFAGTILAIIGAIGALSLAVKGLAMLFTGALLNSLKFAVGGMYAYIAAAMKALGVTTALARAIAATGVGAILSIAGIMAYNSMTPENNSGSYTGGSGMGSQNRGSSPTYNVTFNTDGNPSNSQFNKMQDIARSVGQERDDEEETRSV